MNLDKLTLDDRARRTKVLRSGACGHPGPGPLSCGHSPALRDTNALIAWSVSINQSSSMPVLSLKATPEQFLVGHPFQRSTIDPLGIQRITGIVLRLQIGI